MSIENMGNGPEQKQSDHMQDIMDRCEGNPGALRVLADILKEKGPEVYGKVAHNLGKGSEIWLKYKDECGEDLDALIEKYGQ